MGEEEKKPEEKKVEENDKAKPEEPKKTVVVEEEKKKEEPKKERNEEANKDEKAPPPPPPPQEIVLKVYMHCEGCARKVRRCLKGFQGVEDVMTDCKSHKVVVKGEKADPLKVLERVQRKSHRQVELLSPIPKPQEEKKPEEEKEKPKPEEKKEETPVVTVVLKVYMHCEACAQEIKKRILRMKGVESAEPDLKSSQVTVKGPFDPAKLVDYVYKRTGKHAAIVKQDSDKKEEGKAADDGKKDDKKDGGGEEAAAAGDGDKPKSDGGEEAKPEEGKKDGGDGEQNGGDKANAAVTEESKVVEMKRNEFNYYPQRYAMELYAYNAYAPQIFSDENPNACSVM